MQVPNRYRTAALPMPPSSCYMIENGHPQDRFHRTELHLTKRTGHTRQPRPRTDSGRCRKLHRPRRPTRPSDAPNATAPQPPPMPPSSCYMTEKASAGQFPSHGAAPHETNGAHPATTSPHRFRPMPQVTPAAKTYTPLRRAERYRAATTSDAPFVLLHDGKGIRRTVPIARSCTSRNERGAPGNPRAPRPFSSSTGAYSSSTGFLNDLNIRSER